MSPSIPPPQSQSQSQSQPTIIPSIPIPEPRFLTLPHKPDSPISYTFIPSSSSSSSSSFSSSNKEESKNKNTNTDNKNLILFLNGLGLPAESWIPSIKILLSKRGFGAGEGGEKGIEKGKEDGYSAILTYDRFGQGPTTSRDPLDGTVGRERGHTLEDVVRDLEEVLRVVVATHISISQPSQEQEANKEDGINLLIVGASIGVPLLRLYASSPTRPFPLSGALLLDSNIANTPYSSILPAPDSPAFTANPEKYLGGECSEPECTIEEYTASRGIFVRMFDFDVPNKEGLDRRSSPDLLPSSTGPRLDGGGGNGVEMTVVGHDSGSFIEGSWERVGVHRRVGFLVDRFWKQYNQDLTQLTTPEKCRGPIIAKGCGHFIQEDDPGFVAEEVLGLMGRLGWLGW
ncbi:hypothetical protein HYALB_00009955 [Hymenoscyphus albidus]|uniref:AB hydrolase-1 domain-containing protein n=1 Tax=Hymenoscyphus albidus TaxID=595503 RepID=A0A9N9M3N6_9HELO|nr:hypothetical protein HYALB_00009955 [Hymenoscyphus albidus]